MSGFFLRPSRIKAAPMMPNTSQTGCSSTVMMTGFHNQGET